MASRERRGDGRGPKTPSRKEHQDLKPEQKHSLQRRKPTHRPGLKASAALWHGPAQLGGDVGISRVLGDALKCAGEVNRGTHKFHSYPARLHPDAARILLDLVPGERLLDPFCGGGTVLLEGMVAGRTCSGNDLSPVAVEVAWARTRLWNQGRRDAFLAAARAIGEEAQARCRRRAAAPIPARVLDLRAWYAPQMLGELGWLHTLLQEVEDDDLRRMLRALHSACVIKFSLRASDTSNQRIDLQRPPGAACRHFESKAEELIEQLKEVFDAAPTTASPPTLYHGDVLGLALPNPTHGILTSPPYPGTYDYVELQQLRLAWYGWSQVKEQLARSEIGSRRVFKQPVSIAIQQWTQQTQAWMRHAASLLTPGGRLCVVIGDGFIRGHAVDTAQPTLACAHNLQLKSVATASIERADVAVQRTRREHALLFEKAEQKQD